MAIRHKLMMANMPIAACALLAALALPSAVEARLAGRAPADSNAAPAAAPAAPVTRADFVARLRSEFAKLDTNQDGYISQPELSAAMVAEQARAMAEIRQRRSAAFDAMDTNHDGQLSREEFLAGGPKVPAPDVAAFISRLDTNKDGSLTFEEFSARALAAFDQRRAAQSSQNGR